MKKMFQILLPIKIRQRKLTKFSVTVPFRVKFYLLKLVGIKKIKLSTSNNPQIQQINWSSYTTNK